MELRCTSGLEVGGSLVREEEEEFHISMTGGSM